MVKKSKKKATGKKRVMSAAQKAALAKGRAKLAKSRKKTRFYSGTKAKTKRKKRSSPIVSNEREAMVIINQQGGSMSKKRKAKARKTSRRRGRYMGGSSGGGGGKKGIKSMLMNTVIGTGAAVAGTMLSAKIPIANPKIKSALPLLMGVAISMFLAKGKNAAMMNQAATGLMIAGGLSVVKQFAPQLSLAGEDELYQTYLDSSEGQQLLGVNSDLMGVNSDLMGEEDYDEVDQYDM